MAKSFSGTDEISANTYNLIFGLTTAYGWVVYGLLIAMFRHTQLGIWSFLGLFLMAMAGCFVATSEAPAMKLFGLSMIAGGLGALSGPYVGHFKSASVIDIAASSVILTLILGAIGWIYPKSLASWGSTLFALLVALIVMQLLLPIAYAMLGLPLKGLTNLLDWVGILLFSGYIVYDFNRAQELPKTIDNAMDSGISVFLDIANIFIRLLSLFGDNDD